MDMVAIGKKNCKGFSSLFNSVNEVELRKKNAPIE